MNQLWSGSGLRHVRHIASPAEADLGLPTLFLALLSIPMKPVTCEPLGCSETLLGGWWGHNCFPNGTETLFSFLLCWYLIWWQNRWRAKPWVPEHHQGWALNSTYSDDVFHHHPFAYKKPTSFKNNLDEAINIINFIKSWPMSACLFNILKGRIGSLHNACLQMELQLLFWGKALVLFLWIGSWTSFSWSTVLTLKNNWETIVNQTCVFG